MKTFGPARPGAKTVHVVQKKILALRVDRSHKTTQPLVIDARVDIAAICKREAVLNFNGKLVKARVNGGGESGVEALLSADRVGAFRVVPLNRKLLELE